MKCNHPNKSNNTSKKKRGRWSASEREAGKRIGPAMDNELSELLLGGFRQFYNQRGYTLREAYMKTLLEHFTIGCEERAGNLVPILAPEDQLPTFWQFRHICKSQCCKESHFGHGSALHSLVLVGRRSPGRGRK